MLLDTLYPYLGGFFVLSAQSGAVQVRGRAPVFFFRVVKCAERNRTKRKPLHPLGHRGYIVWCAVQDSNL